MINWPEFRFPPISQRCYPLQFRDFIEYKRQQVINKPVPQIQHNKTIDRILIGR